MSRNGELEEDDDCFYESLDRILSSTSSSTSTSDDDDNCCSKRHHHHIQSPFACPPLQDSMSKYDIWLSAPLSVGERRSRLLRHIGLSSDSSGAPRRHTLPSCSSDPLSGFVSSEPGGDHQRKKPSSATSSPLILMREEPKETVEKITSLNHQQRNSGGGGLSASQPRHDYTSNPCESNCGGGLDDIDRQCTIRDLDNGKEFVLNEFREDGMFTLKEVGTGRQLTLEEFEKSLGHSPIVKELMRRQKVEVGKRENDSDLNKNGEIGRDTKMRTEKKRAGWLKSIRNVATSVTGRRELRSGDERDSSSEKGGRRSSSATDDGQDASSSSSSCHGPERVKVRQYGKSIKDLSALYKSQEIQAHNGSIWSIKFSLDGEYLASAGEDCVIHVWKVLELEKKSELLVDRAEEGNLEMANGSSDPSSVSSPLSDIYPGKKKKGVVSMGRRSTGSHHISVPDNVFSLAEKPFCSFYGHLCDVLDLSWSKSQHLLSSSMDKTVRLWHVSNVSCLKVFSHSDYVTCIQFNPIDDRYFISGSLDSKVRIWSVPDRQVVDWCDLHEMVTAASYTSDGQGAFVGSCKGNCHLYSISENKLQRRSQVNLLKKKKRSQKKITGFQIAPGSSSEAMITSADSRIRVVDGTDMVHKFKGFRNTNSQMAAAFTSNGKYVVCASEDSNVYVWKYESECRPGRTIGPASVTRSYEHFRCKDVTAAVPWPGKSHDNDDVSNGSPPDRPPMPTTPLPNGGPAASPACSALSGVTTGYFFDRISTTWPEEEISVTTSSPAWGLVIITAGLRGQIRTFQNFGYPVRV